MMFSGKHAGCGNRHRWHGDFCSAAYSRSSCGYEHQMAKDDSSSSTPDRYWQWEERWWIRRCGSSNSSVWLHLHWAKHVLPEPKVLLPPDLYAWYGRTRSRSCEPCHMDPHWPLSRLVVRPGRE